jgi:hypothetical protein
MRGSKPAVSQARRTTFESMQVPFTPQTIHSSSRRSAREIALRAASRWL